jgi:hypothetical protein
MKIDLNWLKRFMEVMPEENKANLRKHCAANEGIFNPKLYKKQKEFV